MTFRSALSVGLSLPLVAALGIPRQHSPPGAPGPSAPATATVSSPPLDVGERESLDDALARDRAEKDWFGGEPSPEYLEQKKLLAQQEVQKWASSFRASAPRPRGPLLTGIPGDDAAWVNIGPTGGLPQGRPPAANETNAGRIAIQGIVTHPTDARTLYIATAGGGVWKTTQADLNVADWNWAPITDSLPHASSSGNLACGALEMNPTDPNTLYLGLGDFWSSAGKGLYKTTNGGGDWTELGAIGSTKRVLSILALNATVILVGGDQGLWRSTNGGTEFANVALNGNTTGMIWNIRKLTATRVTLSRESRSAPDAGVGTIWYSDDAGANWTKATIDLGPDILSKLGRITLATSASSNTRGYALVQWVSTPHFLFIIPRRDPGYFLNGLLKTTDGGQNWSWVEANAPKPFDVWTQSSYNHALAVSPNDPDLVFAGGNLTFWRTPNAGRDWEQLTDWLGWTRLYAHADFQTVAFSKTGPLTLFVGNDGGLAVLRSPTAAFADWPKGDGYVAPNADYVDNRHNVGLITQLVYNVGSTNVVNGGWKVSVGLQDNGSRLRRGPSPGTTLYDEAAIPWGDGLAGTGDGIGTLIHRRNAQKILISSYYANIYLSTNDGANFTNTFWSSAWLYAPFYTRLHPGFSDATGRTVFTHTAFGIYRSVDFGANWVLDTLNGALLFGKSIRNFNVSKSNSDSRAMLLGKQSFLLPPPTGAGFDNVDILVTHDLGQNWKVVQDPPAGDPQHRALLSYVWFKSDDDSALYVASVSLNTEHHHLFKSNDGGDTWASSDNGLPAVPVHVIKNDLSHPNDFLAGTDFGVYVSHNAGSTWARYGTGLPLVAVKDIYIAPDGSDVRIATFGRGVWQAGTPGPGEDPEGGED